MSNFAAPVKEAPVTNDISNYSIEQLEDMKSYMHQHGLHAYALDLQFVIADKIMEGVEDGEIPTYPESDTKATLKAVKELVRKQHGGN